MQVVAQELVSELLAVLSFLPLLFRVASSQIEHQLVSHCMSIVFYCFLSKVRKPEAGGGGT